MQVREFRGTYCHQRLLIDLLIDCKFEDLSSAVRTATSAYWLIDWFIVGSRNWVPQYVLPPAFIDWLIDCRFEDLNSSGLTATSAYWLIDWLLVGSRTWIPRYVLPPARGRGHLRGAGGRRGLLLLWTWTPSIHAQVQYSTVQYSTVQYSSYSTVDKTSTINQSLSNSYLNFVLEIGRLGTLTWW